MVTEFAETATAVEEVAVGAAQAAAEVVSDPVGSARKQVKSLERKEVFGIEINGKLPEKLAIKGLQQVKVQARRQDTVGDVAKRTLRIFNGSFKTIARTATRLELATDLTPQRVAERKPRRRSARRRAA